MTLDIFTAHTAAQHWLRGKYPSFEGPKLSWPATPEIDGWQESRTIPAALDLSDFSTIKEFAPALKCIAEYQEKLLTQTLEYLPETHELVTIEIRCNRELDPHTNTMETNKLFVFGRLMAKPK